MLFPPVMYPPGRSPRPWKEAARARFVKPRTIAEVARAIPKRVLFLFWLFIVFDV
jgi:hypothetical protein